MREFSSLLSNVQIAAGKVKVNPKNHVKRKGGAEDNEDKEVSGALDELDGEFDSCFGFCHATRSDPVSCANSPGQYVCRSVEMKLYRTSVAQIPHHLTCPKRGSVWAC